MILTDQGPHYWNRDTGESRWKLEDGLWLRPDGHNVDLRDKLTTVTWFVLVHGWVAFIIMCQSTESFVRISFPGFARAVRTCLGVACGMQSLDSSGDDLVYGRNAWLDSGFGDCDSTWLLDEFHTISTLRRTRILKCSFSIRFKWRSVPRRCFWLQFCFAQFAPGNLEFLSRVPRGRW